MQKLDQAIIPDLFQFHLFVVVFSLYVAVQSSIVYCCFFAFFAEHETVLWYVSSSSSSSSSFSIHRSPLHFLSVLLYPALFDPRLIFVCSFVSDGLSLRNRGSLPPEMFFAMFASVLYHIVNFFFVRGVLCSNLSPPFFCCNGAFRIASSTFLSDDLSL